MEVGGDDLLLRFTFLEALQPGNTRPINQLINKWHAGIPEEYQPAYIDDFRFKKGRKVSCWLFIDTSGNDPGLSAYLNDLFRRMNDFAPLELVEISDGYHE